MTKGVYTSPVTYEDRDANGNVIAQFLVNFSPSSGTDPTTLALTGITAYNVQGSGLTEIAVNKADGSTSVFPLPTSGKKVAISVTDAQGNPATAQAYTATVSQAQINAAGFTVLGDIAGETVY